MNVTLHQLRAFERVVRLGSFRAAARELRLSQPSVSQRIRELEATLRLGASETFALVCLPELLRRLELRYPAISTSVFIGDTGVVSRMLNGRELDIAVVSEPQVAKHLKQEPLGKNEFGWFAAAASDLPRRVLSPSDLGSYHLIVPPSSARLHVTVMQWFSEAGTRPARISSC